MSAAPGGSDSPGTDGRPETDGRPGSDGRLSVAAVSALHADHARELQGFLWGLLRDQELAEEALQSTFQRVLEVGHTARSDSIKGWLFKVAFHEAMLIRRRNATHERVLKKYSDSNSSHPTESDSNHIHPAVRLVTQEEVTRLRAAMQELPVEQRDVVERRIYQEQTFAGIAAELQLPLGTVLTRMRLAMEKLQKRLKPLE